MFARWVPNPWWQQQLPGMTIAMMHQLPLPVEQLEENVSEKQVCNSQTKDCEVNISENLKRRACEADCLFKEALSAAQEAVRELASVQDFLNDVIVATDLGWKPGCTLELDAAKAFIHITDFLKQQSSGESTQLPKNVVQLLQSVQIRLRDLVVLACSRGIEPSLFRSSGVPPELRSRLKKALGSDHWDDVNLRSSCGNSKFHMWNKGERFEMRPDRIGRGPRRWSRRFHAYLLGNAKEGADCAEISGSAGSSSDKAAVLQAGPAYITTTVTWGPIECSLNAE